MNYNSMSDQELIHYLDLYSDDPLIRRLATMLSNTRGSIISDLESAGMNPDTWTFDSEWGSMYPGEYIEELRKDLSTAEDELSRLKYQYEDVVEERDQLKTRTIMDFVQEVQKERLRASLTASDALKEAKAQKEENDRLKEKIDMWAKMNQPERKLA